MIDIGEPNIECRHIFKREKAVNMAQYIVNHICFLIFIYEKQP